MDSLFSSTKQLAAAIRAGQVSATEVLEAHLAQIARHNATLNAIILLDAERAHQRAREADEALARGEVWGPLHGVPFTLKDCHSTQGMRTTAGFPPLADYVPQVDSTITARLKAAGGILIGKTNVPTLLTDIQSNNPLFGRTNNPWNGERTPGGSSGGAAAALASGMTPFDIGTDLAGSIRIPAHYCGVFGLKPTEHRVPETGLITNLPDAPRSVRILASLGPMARSAEDLALLYQLIAGPDGCDTEVAPVTVDNVPALELKHLRMAFAPTFPGFPAAVEVRQAVEGLAKQLTPLCAAVEEAALSEVDFNQQLVSARELKEMTVGAFQPEEDAPVMTLAHYLEALHRRDQCIRRWEQFFQSWDVLLCPASMIPAFPHCKRGSPLLVDGKREAYGMANAHCQLFNYTGHPAIVLPYQLSHEGLPIGVQMVGKRWGEARLLGIAQAVSEVIGGFQRPPGY